MINFKIIMNFISLWAIPIIILTILIFALFKKTPVYETFIEGAKEGATTGFKIFPYLIAIIVAISMFRASGAIELLEIYCSKILTLFQIPADVLPIMLIRSLSGSAILGLLSDIANQTGINSFATKLSAIMVGSSETTFYVLSVYFGAVGIKKFRYALIVGILADIVGIITAIIIARIIFL